MITDLINEKIVKIILSNKVNKDYDYNKVIIKPVKIKDNVKYQFESFTDKQAFHINLSLEEAKKKIEELFNEHFKQLDAYLLDEYVMYKKSKKGKILTTSKKLTNNLKVSLDHNKQKKYIINEGDIIPPLIDLGVMTNEGKIVKSKYDKFKQICRFLEMIDDAIKDEKELNIIDFGCGKSYLTFVLYYYLVDVKKMNVKIIGLDLKKDVIAQCNEIRDKYKYQNLDFKLGDISLYKPDFKVDMIITLHACDVATDYAIYHAINYQVKYLFSVPCCQHEINNQLKNSSLHLINKYGLLKERFSSLLTDAIRANILEYFGYKVQVLEFIDSIHSPKNILLRCSYQEINDTKQEVIKKELDELLKDYQIKQTLYDLMFTK